MAEVTPLPNHLSGMILQVVQRPKKSLGSFAEILSQRRRWGFRHSPHVEWKSTIPVPKNRVFRCFRNAVESSLKCSNHFFWKGVSCLKLVPGNLKDAFSMLDSHFKHWLREQKTALPKVQPASKKKNVRIHYQNPQFLLPRVSMFWVHS